MNMQTHLALETSRSQEPCRHGFEGLIRRLGWRRLFVVLVGLIILALSGHASAQDACTGTSQTLSFPLPASINVRPTDPVGTLINGSWIAAPITPSFNCTAAVGSSTGISVTAPPLTDSGLTAQGPQGQTIKVWNTNVPGIGLGIAGQIQTQTCGRGGPTGASWYSTPYTSTCIQRSPNHINSVGVAVALVKTGPVAPGTINVGIIAQALSIPDAGAVITYTLNPINIVAPTCTMSVPNIPLGSFSADSFTGNTSTPDVAVPVTASGCAGNLTNIVMSFNGTADTRNPALFAANSVAGNVTGVGIGLKYAPPSQAPMPVTPNVTTGTWRIAAGNTMQLLANFVQTEPTVTAGSVSTPVTIQFTYQ